MGHNAKTRPQGCERVRRLSAENGEIRPPVFKNLQEEQIVVAYFSEVLTVVNLPRTVEPRPLTAVIITRAMPAAMRAYSIAVEPDRSAKNLTTNLFKVPPVRKKARCPGFLANSEVNPLRLSELAA